MKINMEMRWCIDRHRCCRVRGADGCLLFSMLTLGQGSRGLGIASRCLALFLYMLSHLCPLQVTPKDITVLQCECEQVPISASLTCQGHAGWQLYLQKKEKKKKAQSKHNCQNMYIVVEKPSSIKSKKQKRPLPHPRNI